MFPSILPKDIASTRRDLSDGTPAFYLNHARLGELGRIVVFQDENGQTNILTEITGDDTDPMAEQRRAAFEPIGHKLQGELQRLLRATPPQATDPKTPSPAGRSHVIPSKLMQCSRSGEYYAHLIFVETQATPGEMENTARIMFPKIKEIDLPTWIIGAPMEDGVPENAQSMILKVWPDRQDIAYMTPDQFNKMLREVEQERCPGL